LYKIKKGKQEVYVKDDAELNAYLMSAALENAALHVNVDAPALSGTALESLANEFMTVENIIRRLSNRYDEVVLRCLSDGPEVTSDTAEDIDALEAWTHNFSTSLPKSSGDRVTNGNGGSYFADFEPGDGEGEGVRVVIRKEHHGVSQTRYIPREFFDSNEYRAIMALAGKLKGLLGEGAYVERGEKREQVETFAAAVDWLMGEARRGQSIQRYKGLGEMNPDQLWDTTVNPETRRLMQVKIEDAVKADEIFTTLMGDHVEPRREFIEKNALTVSNLDV
jgi:DNA gyrase subunit B